MNQQTLSLDPLIQNTLLLPFFTKNDVNKSYRATGFRQQRGETAPRHACTILRLLLPCDFRCQWLKVLGYLCP